MDRTTVKLRLWRLLTNVVGNARCFGATLTFERNWARGVNTHYRFSRCLDAFTRRERTSKAVHEIKEEYVLSETRTCWVKTLTILT